MSPIYQGSSGARKIDDFFFQDAATFKSVESLSKHGEKKKNEWVKINSVLRE